MTSIKFAMDGWKAVFAREFTFANCRLVSQAIATYLTAQNLTRKGLIIAYDHRFMAEVIARECARVIVGNGIRTYVMRKAAPTPLAGFAVRHLEAGGALVITGGHYAPEYCGIKYLDSYGGPVLPEITETLEKEIERLGANGRIYELDLYEAEKLDLYKEIDLERVYQDALKKLIQARLFDKRNIKVVVDPMFGSGTGYLEKILQELGCEVKTIHNYRDPLFGGTPPEPTADNLLALQNAVLTYQADIGLAMDGEAGRFGVVDDEGVWLESGQCMALLLGHLVKTRSTLGPAARTRATSTLVDRVAGRNGLQLHETQSGFAYLSQVLRERSCLLVGDETGQLGIAGHVPIADGILAGLLAVEMLLAEERPLSMIVKEFAADYGSPVFLRYNIPLGPENKEEVEKKITQCQVRNLAGMKVISCDCGRDLKIYMENGNWVLVRMSGLDSFLNVYIEGESQEQVELIKDALLSMLGLLPEDK
ncbi:MAG: phosphoglucomutase/phosphomannomutase family protein [Syntrophomonadaceae bacterium]